MSKSPIRMACFDVGGVLVKHCRTWREGCVAAGLPLRSGAETPEMSSRRKHLAQLFTVGKLQEHEFYAQMADTTGGLYTAPEIARIHTAWLGPEYPHVGPVVSRLVHAGRVETGVLSNTNAAHWSRFEQRNGAPPEFPAAAMLRHRHASHLLGFAKPMAEIYAEFERRTGFRGSEILFLEDLPENAAAATARGWTVELIDHTRDTADQIQTALKRHNAM